MYSGAHSCVDVCDRSVESGRLGEGIGRIKGVRKREEVVLRQLTAR